MSGAVLPPIQDPAEALPRKRFTREDVDRLAEAGVFEGQRFELIDGDLIDKTGQKPPHAFAIRLVQDWLASVFGASLLHIQLPIEASGEDQERSLPEPDVAVLIERKPEYRKRHPRGDELLLVVEVSDTTAAFDLSRKAVLYARAGVPEYWVLNLARRMLVVHRQPEGSTYRRTQILPEGESVCLEGRTESVRVSDILPEM